jgi:hypothetical protein
VEWWWNNGGRRADFQLCSTIFNYVQPLVIAIVECGGIMVEGVPIFNNVQQCSTIFIIHYNNCRMLLNSGGIMVEGGPIKQYSTTIPQSFHHHSTPQLIWPYHRMCIPSRACPGDLVIKWRSTRAGCRNTS